MAIYTHPSYVPELPSDSQVNGVFTLSGNAALTVNMLGALIRLNGHTLTIAALASDVSGAVYVAGAGTLAGAVTETLAANSVALIVFGEAGVFVSKVSSIPGLQALLDAKANTDDLGTAATADTGTAEGNVPLLGVGGKLSAAQLPAVALTQTVPVANAAARLALSSEQAQGKIVVEADTGKSYGLVVGGVPATSGDWLQVGDRDITAADITDATVAGRALLMAATILAQRQALEIEPAIDTVSGTTHTLDAGDLRRTQRATNAAGCAITIPLNSSVPVAIGDYFPIRRAVGAGALSFANDGSITVNGNNIAGITAGQTFVLQNVSPNVWDFI